MPTLLTWNYVGVHCAEAGTEEPQRLYPGDIGLDDVFGEVVIKSMTGGSLVVEYSDGDEKVTKERTVGHIRAKEGRAQQRAAPATGRPRQARGGIHNFFGAAGGEASPQAVPKKQLAPNAKGLGRTVQQPATGKAPAAKKTTAAKQPAAAKTPTAIAKAAGKRKAGADADGQEELEQEQQVNPVAMLLGDAYAVASSDEEDDNAQKRAKPGAVSVRAMSAEDKAAYKHAKYEQTQKDKQEKWRQEFSLWLKVDPKVGFHCSVCFGAKIKAADKLCTTGYGYIGDGADKQLVPIPSHQKLVLHETQESHKLNMKSSTASDTKARAPQSHTPQSRAAPLSSAHSRRPAVLPITVDQDQRVHSVGHLRGRAVRTHRAHGAHCGRAAACDK